MDKDLFKELLYKHRMGKASAEERLFILKYYELFEADEDDEISFLDEKQQEDLKLSMQSNIWNAIEEHERKQSVQSTRSLLIRRLSLAAVLILAVTAGIYFFKPFASKDEVNLAKRATPVLHRYIRLPDGSTVIAHADTELRFPAKFDDHGTREVFLEGEAYFDIRHNAEKPFIIHTGKIRTHVLGTAFNIRAWPADADITVTVSRGRVQVSEEDVLLGIITPNQQIVFTKAGSKVSKQDVNAYSYLNLQGQDLLIDDVTLAEAAELLESRFRVKVKVQDEKIRNQRFTTTFLKNESLEQVLKSICEFNGATYSFDKENGLVEIRSIRS